MRLTFRMTGQSPPAVEDETKVALIIGKVLAPSVKGCPDGSTQRKAGDRIDLPPHGELEASCHVIDEDSILAIDAALATFRPLLVRGEPGVGKSARPCRGRSA